MGVWTFAKALTYTDFSAAATTKTVALYTVDHADTVIEDVFMNCSTKLIGGAISAATLAIGVVGATAKYMTAADIFTAATDVYGFKAKGNHAIGTTIDALLTTTGANTSAATQGVFRFFVKLGRLPIPRV